MHFCTILSVCLLQNCKLFFVRFTSPLTFDCICRGRPLWVSFSLSRYPGASSASSLQCWLLLFKILCLSSLTFGFLKIYFFLINISFHSLFFTSIHVTYIFLLVQLTGCCGTSGSTEKFTKIVRICCYPFFYVSGGSLRLFTKSPNLATAVPLFFRDASSIVYLPGDFSTTLYQLLPSLNFSSLASLFPS